MKMFRFALIVCLYCVCVISNANTFESLVMPGDVIDGHKKVETECSSCHELFDSSKQNKLCLDCHEDIDSDLKKRQGYHGKNKPIKTAECKSCHTEHKGRNADVVKLDVATFNHNLTDFRLKGRHQVVECNSCHEKGKKYREAPNRCKTCHKKDNPHKKAKAKKGRFDKCETCHDQSDWNKISFSHKKNTKYKLTGAHETALCQSCHVNQKYKDTPKLCISCHKADDAHNGKNGKKCNSCHNTTRWKKITFDHDKDTRFKLRYKHKKTSCSSCHKNVRLDKKKINKKKKPRACSVCHSYDDSHDGRFGNKCHKCHTDKKWDQAKFNHNKDTKFKLRGKHKKTNCNQCHTALNKNNKLKQNCVSCHKSDDIHKGSLGGKCESCHTETKWSEKVRFDHDITKFPLIGLHGVVSCNECHTDSNYETNKAKCISCHKDKSVHDGRLGDKCDRCHTPNGWRVWVFNHNKETKFKIDGAHKKVHCHSCHVKQITNTNRTPRDCRSCHSTDDIHNGQFGAQCSDCHTTKAFNEINM